MNFWRRIWRLLSGRKNWAWTYDDQPPMDLRIVSPEDEKKNPAHPGFYGDGGN